MKDLSQATGSGLKVTDATVIEETQDDGGDAPLGEVTLKQLKDAIDDIATEGKNGNWRSHADTEAVRYCIWDHQDPDGLKHARNNADEPVTPFENWLGRFAQARVGMAMLQESSWLRGVLGLAAPELAEPLRYLEAQAKDRDGPRVRATAHCFCGT